MNKVKIKTILRNPAWEEIETFFEDKIREWNTLTNLKGYGVSRETVIGRLHAVELMLKALTELELIKMEEEPKEKKIYK